MSTTIDSRKQPALPALRPATLADAALLAEMHSRSRASAYRGLVPDNYLDGVMHDELRLHWQTKLDALQTGAGLALIAELAGRAIGFVCMSEPDADGSVYIDNLHAMPGHKGAGVGTLMLDAARAWAETRQASQMHLMVIEGNDAAIGFYEHRGWHHAGSETDMMGGIEIAALRYVLPL